MIFRYFFRDLLHRLPTWDPASKASLGIAVVLLLLLIWLGFVGPQEIQVPARFGAFGLLLTMQLLFFWGNRRSISPYHRAQQHFLDGEFVIARKILEQLPESGRASVDALVLLGNTYRHLGEFDLGERALQRALQHKPDYHYALYAAGKLLLVTGRFEQASEQLERALETGAPGLVHFDAGLARFMQDDTTSAMQHFARFLAGDIDESEKAMLATFCQSLIGNGEPPPASEIRQKTSFWKEEATKHAQSPYGSKLLELVEIMRLHIQSDGHESRASSGRFQRSI